MSSQKFGGIALLGAAALGGLYLLSKTSERDATDLTGLGGGSALGTGGSTALVPGTESATTPYTSAEDSIAKGIEDTPDAALMGATEISASGVSNMPASQIDAMQFDTVSTLGSAGVAVGAGAAGSLAGRLSGGLLGRVLSKGLGAVGLALFAGDAYDIRKGIEAYAESINPGSVARVEDKMKGMGVHGVEGTLGGRAILGFGQAMSGLNVVIGDTIAETVLGGPKPSETMTPTPSQEGYGAVDRVTSNYGVSDKPTLSKPYTGSTIGALNVIADTPVGTTWTHTYSSQKKGTSGIAGSTNTYKASSGQQVALAGISASDYAAYLAEKRK